MRMWRKYPQGHEIQPRYYLVDNEIAQAQAVRGRPPLHGRKAVVAVPLVGAVSC